jgi:hypothetical protein
VRSVDYSIKYSIPKLIDKSFIITNQSLIAFAPDCPVPFSIVFGGTDLNEHVEDSMKFQVMTQVVKNAKYVSNMGGLKQGV